MKRTLIFLAMMIFITIPMAMAQSDDPAPAGAAHRGRARIERQIIQERGMGKGMGMGRGMGMRNQMMGRNGFAECLKELDLTDEQKAKMEDIHFTNRNAMIDLRASMQKARLKMHREMMADTPDKARLLSASKEVNTIHGQIADARINHLFALRAVLTPEQLKKWKEFRGGCGLGIGLPMGPQWGDLDDENEMENDEMGMQPSDFDSRTDR